jgi:glycosyltransferase involved in cell wall biosynthesis
MINMKENNINKVPKVSIGMPVYNGDATIEKTIKTILNQNFNDYELIISDDFSSDSTQEICQRYADIDSRIKYFRQGKNFGMPVKNFQYVLSKAKGEFFMFASHDDPYHPEFISEMLKVMEFDKNCSLCFCSYSISDENSSKEIKISPSSSCSSSSVSRYISRLIDMQPALIYGMFRKKFFHSEHLKLFDFFEVNAGIEMALKGNIRVVNKELWKWKIDSSRTSYSIYPFFVYVADIFGFRYKSSSKIQRVNYLPFYLSQIKLIYSNFSFIKSTIIFLILSYYILKKIALVLFKPRSSDINFDKA